MRITSAPTEHRPVHPTVAYRIDADGGSVVLAGDTVPCAGLDELCVGADVYVQTVVRDDEILDGASPFVGFVVSPEAKLTLRPLSSLTWEVGYQHRQIYDTPGGTLLAEQPLVRQNLQIDTYLTRI